MSTFVATMGTMMKWDSVASAEHYGKVDRSVVEAAAVVAQHISLDLVELDYHCQLNSDSPLVSIANSSRPSHAPQDPVLMTRSLADRHLDFEGLCFPCSPCSS